MTEYVTPLYFNQLVETNCITQPKRKHDSSHRLNACELSHSSILQAAMCMQDQTIECCIPTIPQHKATSSSHHYSITSISNHCRTMSCPNYTYPSTFISLHAHHHLKQCNRLTQPHLSSHSLLLSPALLSPCSSPLPLPPPPSQFSLHSKIVT